MEECMKSLSRRVRAAGLAASLTVTALALGTGSRADDNERWSRSLAGTWRVQVTLRDCDTGAPLPLPPFAAMLTFAEGGTLTGTTSNPLFRTGQRSPDHGIWQRTGWRRYRAVSEAYILFD